MFKLFKRQVLYVRIHKNKMEVRNLDSGRTASKIAGKQFSNDRLLIANFQNAELLLQELIKKTTRKKGFISPAFHILIQPISEYIKDISEVEHRVYVDAAEHAGAIRTIVYENQRKLTDYEVLSVFEKENN